MVTECIQNALGTWAVLVMKSFPFGAERFNLSHIETEGWFAETWHSDLKEPQAALPLDYAGPRSARTAILLLLMRGNSPRATPLEARSCGVPPRKSVDSGSSSTSRRRDNRPARNGHCRRRRPQVMAPQGNWQWAKPRDDEPTLVSYADLPVSPLLTSRWTPLSREHRHPRQSLALRTRHHVC